MKIQQYAIENNSLKSQELIIAFDEKVFYECEKATKKFNENSEFVHPIDVKTFCNGLLSVMKFPIIKPTYVVALTDNVKGLKMLPSVLENCKKYYQLCVDSYIDNYLKESAKEDPLHYQRFKDVIRDKEMAWVLANFKFDAVINTLLMALINKFTEEDGENLADWITDYFANQKSTDANR